MDRFRGFLLHICIICSLVYMIAKVIDWYNPYMDFSGRILWVQAVIWVGVNLLFLTGIHKTLRRKRHLKK